MLSLYVALRSTIKDWFCNKFNFYDCRDEIWYFQQKS